MILRSWVNHWIDRMGYRQRYAWVLLLFFSSFLVLILLLLKEVKQNLDIYNLQLAGGSYERPLRELMELVPRHQAIWDQYREGDVSLKGDLGQLDLQIQQALKSLKEKNEQFQQSLNGFSDTDITSPNELMISWDMLKAHAMDPNVETGDTLHAQFIRQARNLLSSANRAFVFYVDQDHVTSSIMSAAFIRQPEAEDLLEKISTIGQAAIRTGSLNVQNRDELIGSLALLNANIEGYYDLLNQLKNDNNRNPRLELESLFTTYFVKVKEFIEQTRENFLNSDKVTINKDVWSAEVRQVEELSFRFWDTAFDAWNQIITSKKATTERFVISMFILSGLLALMGVALGYYFILITADHSLELKHKIDEIAKGNLTTRIKVHYHDELGIACESFNHMADYVERVIGELRHLLDAIRLFGDGDFSVRVAINNPEDEIGRVGLSFNQMAESFGSIINQLRDLGINLTASATQITQASRQQELNITEQEATTREISVTAHEISTTAKEFANTVNEVSRVAEQTSSLASVGKESLSQMETAMRQMMDASSNIASKLAILNEKAGNITSIITTITKVADQTNLLSLSAAIEAEKAGEFGRSFAVIAREIRRLADLVAFATLDIEKIVNEIMSAVSSSVMGVDDFTQEIKGGVGLVSRVSEQLSTIIEGVQVLNKRFDSVNHGMQAQAVGAEQINEAISNLNKTAKEASNSLTAFRHTLQQLTAASSDVKSAVDRLKKHNLAELERSLSQLQAHKRSTASEN